MTVLHGLLNQAEGCVVSAFDDIQKAHNLHLKQYFNKRPIHTPYPENSRVTIFNTVSKGEVLWHGEIGLNGSHSGQGVIEYAGYYPPGSSYEQWESMNILELPTMLQDKDGQTLYGSLEHQNMRGSTTVWFLQQFGQAGKDGYDARRQIQLGDVLTVYKSVEDGNISENGFYNSWSCPPARVEFK